MNHSMIVRPQDEKTAAKATATGILALVSVIYIIGALSVEVFNGVTTFVTFGNLFNLMIGTMETGNTNLWSLLATIAMTSALMLSDVGALARLFTPVNTEGEEPGYVWGLFILWMVVGVFNALLTYMFIADSVWKISPNAMAPSNIAIMHYFPLVLSIIVYLARTINMFMLGKVLDKWLHGRYTTSPLVAVGMEFINHDSGKNRQPAQRPAAPRPAAAMRSGSPIPTSLNSSAMSARPQVKTVRPNSGMPPVRIDPDDPDDPSPQGYHSIGPR